MKRLLVSLTGAWWFIAAGCAPVATELNVQQEVAREKRVRELLIEARDLLRSNSVKNHRHALQALELGRELMPSDPRILDGIGCVEWRLGNEKTAEYFFKKALASKPNYDRAYAHLALVAESRGEFVAAIGLYRRALNHNPMNARARNNLAVLLLDNSRDPLVRRRAEEQIRRAAHSFSKKDAVVEYNLLQFQ